MPLWGPAAPSGHVVVRSSRQGPTVDQLAARLGLIAHTLRRALVVTAAAVGAAALAKGVPDLAVASIALSVVIVVFVGLSRWWDTLPTGVEPSEPTASHGSALLTQAAALVTLQGVVLGLVLALAGDDSPSITVKVAGVALVVGVLVGLLLVTLTAIGAPGQPRLMVATILFSLTVWAGGYGLLCLAASLAFHHT